MNKVLPAAIVFLLFCAVFSASVFAETPNTATSGNKNIIVPAPLKIGDKVGIVAPANKATQERLQHAVEFLTEKGFDVVVSDNIDTETEYGVGDGSERIRADAFNVIARNPDIRAIFCLRGGYGSMHTLQNIDYEALRQNRPIIVGYSDITALYTAIFQKTGLVTFHGPMLASNRGQTESFERLFELLMNPKAEFPLENIDGTDFSVINEGIAEGIIVGGNLTLICSLMGTEYELDVKDKILFIEDLDEAPYRLHRYMWQLKLAGKLDEVAAIVIGDILPDREYDDPEISLKVILDVLKDVKVPILYNVRAGHGKNPLTIPMGAMVRIVGNKMTVSLSGFQQSGHILPDDFFYVTDIVPDVILEIRYFSTYNFLGTRVDDYLAPVAILSRQAAKALKQVNDDVRAKGYVLKVFDAYRPQGAVDHFVRWAADPNDILTKEYFYPDLDKDRLLPERYIMARSAHSRGSTVDLTLVEMRTGKEVDMGSPFDFFGLISHHGTGLITEKQSNNRLILKNAMEKAGFELYDEEWWHYTLVDEPYPDTYFSFPVQ